MKFDDFINHVDNLVDQWRPISDSEAGPDRRALETIYQEVREQAVYDLAEAVRARDHATRTHGMLIITDRKHQTERKKP